MEISKIFTDIYFIKGYTRCLLIDFTRSNTVFLPKAWHDLIHKIEQKSRVELNILQDQEKIFFDFLAENDYIFFIDEKSFQNFPAISNEWDYPSLVSNCSIILDEFSCDNLNLAFQKLISLGCLHYNLRVNKIFNPKEIIEFLNLIRSLPIFSISIQFENALNLSKEILIPYISASFKIKSIVIFNASFNHSELINSSYIYITKSNFLPNSGMSPEFLSFTRELFTESLHYHSYFNRKLVIDKGFQIKNFSAQSSLGNILIIDKTELEKIVQSENFQKYWYVLKDETAVCRDCEFRYSCVDDRIPKKNKKGYWFHESECNYNPYIAKWQWEEGYHTLEECGVVSNENGFSIDHERIAAINETLWGSDE